MKRIILYICGWTLVALAVIGIFLPVLPTTPFVLLAGICFSHSSERAYRFLLRNRMFGPYIENYKTKQGVSVACKVRGIIMLWLLLILAAVSMAKVWSTVMFVVIGTGVTIHLLMLKTKREKKPQVQHAKQVHSIDPRSFSKTR